MKWRARVIDATARAAAAEEARKMLVVWSLRGTTGVCCAWYAAAATQRGRVVHAWGVESGTDLERLGRAQ